MKQYMYVTGILFLAFTTASCSNREHEREDNVKDAPTSEGTRNMDDQAGVSVQPGSDTTRTVNNATVQDSLGNRTNQSSRDAINSHNQQGSGGR